MGNGTQHAALTAPLDSGPLLPVLLAHLQPPAPANQTKHKQQPKKKQITKTKASKLAPGLGASAMTTSGTEKARVVEIGSATGTDNAQWAKFSPQAAVRNMQ